MNLREQSSFLFYKVRDEASICAFSADSEVSYDD